MDGGGWPLCLNSTQSICDQEAYIDPYGTPATYTEAQLRHLVEFATARGVRIMPESDSSPSPPLARSVRLRSDPVLCVQVRPARAHRRPAVQRQAGALPFQPLRS